MLADWVRSSPKVQKWVGRLSKRSLQTSQLYASQLFQYWTHYLSKTFKTLEDWVSKTTEEVQKYLQEG